MDTEEYRQYVVVAREELKKLPFFRRWRTLRIAAQDETAVWRVFWFLPVFMFLPVVTGALLNDQSDYVLWPSVGLAVLVDVFLFSRVIRSAGEHGLAAG